MAQPVYSTACLTPLRGGCWAVRAKKCPVYSSSAPALRRRPSTFRSNMMCIRFFHDASQPACVLPRTLRQIFDDALFAFRFC